MLRVCLVWEKEAGVDDDRFFAPTFPPLESVRSSFFADVSPHPPLFHPPPPPAEPALQPVAAGPHSMLRHFQQTGRYSMQKYFAALLQVLVEKSEFWSPTWVAAVPISGCLTWSSVKEAITELENKRPAGDSTNVSFRFWAAAKLQKGWNLADYLVRGAWDEEVRVSYLAELPDAEGCTAKQETFSSQRVGLGEGLYQKDRCTFIVGSEHLSDRNLFVAQLLMAENGEKSHPVDILTDKSSIRNRISVWHLPQSTRANLLELLNGGEPKDASKLDAFKRVLSDGSDKIGEGNLALVTYCRKVKTGAVPYILKEEFLLLKHGAMEKIVHSWHLLRVDEEPLVEETSLRKQKPVKNASRFRRVARQRRHRRMAGHQRQ